MPEGRAARRITKAARIPATRAIRVPAIRKAADRAEIAAIVFATETAVRTSKAALRENKTAPRAQPIDHRETVNVGRNQTERK